MNNIEGKIAMADTNHHIIQTMDNDQVRTILSRMMSVLQGKSAPENTLEEKLSALAIAIDALNFVDGDNYVTE